MMKSSQKVFTALSALVLALSLAGCGQPAAAESEPDLPEKEDITLTSVEESTESEEPNPVNNLVTTNYDRDMIISEMAPSDGSVSEALEQFGSESVADPEAQLWDYATQANQRGYTVFKPDRPDGIAWDMEAYNASLDASGPTNQDLTIGKSLHFIDGSELWSFDIQWKTGNVFVWRRNSAEEEWELYYGLEGNPDGTQFEIQEGYQVPAESFLLVTDMLGRIRDNPSIDPIYDKLVDGSDPGATA